MGLSVIARRQRSGLTTAPCRSTCVQPIARPCVAASHAVSPPYLPAVHCSPPTTPAHPRLRHRGRPRRSVKVAAGVLAQQEHTTSSWSHCDMHMLTTDASRRPHLMQVPSATMPPSHSALRTTSSAWHAVVVPWWLCRPCAGHGCMQTDTRMYVLPSTVHEYCWVNHNCSVALLIINSTHLTLHTHRTHRVKFVAPPFGPIVVSKDAVTTGGR